MKYRWYYLIGGILLLLICSGLGLSPFDPVIEFCGFLLIGWIRFLGRVVPQMTVEWNGVVTSMVCLILLAGGLHYFGRWFWSQNTEGETTSRWSARWTFAVLALVVLMFTAGISAVGITHQTV